jgi:hypothetical protein
VKTGVGQKFHHLYFWHLCEEMGVLKNVLNVLSAEVAGDTDSPPGETTCTQKRRTRVNVSDDEDERTGKKKFREDVAKSLKSIGEGMKSANTLRAIVAMRAAIRAEEDKLQMLRFRVIVCSEEEKKVCESLTAHHANRVADYEDELADLIVASRDGH